MTISWIQAILLGIFASLSSMPGMGGSSIGNYTLGRPLIGGLISGLILGDVTTGIMVGVALQVVYIALVTPGGTVSADVRAISYIGVPLAILFVHANNITDEAAFPKAGGGRDPLTGAPAPISAEQRAETGVDYDPDEDDMKNFSDFINTFDQLFFFCTFHIHWCRQVITCTV